MSSRAIAYLWFLAVAAGAMLAFVHFFFFEGWCGYFDGGPEPYQENWCRDPAGGNLVRWVPLLPPFTVAVGATVSTVQQRVGPFLISLLVAVAVVAILPYTLVELVRAI